MKNKKLPLRREAIRTLKSPDLEQAAGGIIRTYPPNECFNYTDDRRTNCPTATCTCTQTHD